MKRIILHAGLGKTGTSTIQSTLAASRPLLAGIGAAYPGTADAHHDLLALVHQAGGCHFWFRNRGLSEAQAFGLATAQMDEVEQAARAEVPVILLSSEYFQTLRAPQYTALDDRFAALGYRLETLCFIREPLALTASRIGQAVKMGTFRLPDLLHRPYQAHGLAHVRSALRALGRARVHVHRMETAQDTGLAATMLVVAGLTPPPGLVDEVRNAGLNRAGVYLVDAVNAVDDDARSLAQRMMPHARAMAGPRFELPPDIARRIVAESRPEQDWLDHRLGLGYAEPDIPDVPDAATLMAQAARDLVRLGGPSVSQSGLSRTGRVVPGWLRRSPARSR